MVITLKFSVPKIVLTIPNSRNIPTNSLHCFGLAHSSPSISCTLRKPSSQNKYIRNQLPNWLLVNNVPTHLPCTYIELFIRLMGAIRIELNTNWLLRLWYHIMNLLFQKHNLCHENTRFYIIFLIKPKQHDRENLYQLKI